MLPIEIYIFETVQIKGKYYNANSAIITELYTSTLNCNMNLLLQ